MKKVLNLHNFRRLISRQSKIVTKMMKSIPSIWVYNKRQKLLHHTACGPRSASILVLLVWPCQLQSRLDLRLHQQANMRVNKHNPIANKTRNRNRFDTFKRGVFFFLLVQVERHTVAEKVATATCDAFPIHLINIWLCSFPIRRLGKMGSFFWSHSTRRKRRDTQDKHTVRAWHCLPTGFRLFYVQCTVKKGISCIFYYLFCLISTLKRMQK